MWRYGKGNIQIKPIRGAFHSRLRTSGMPTPRLMMAFGLVISNIARCAMTRRGPMPSWGSPEIGALTPPVRLRSSTGPWNVCQWWSGGARTTCRDRAPASEAVKGPCLVVHGGMKFSFTFLNVHTLTLEYPLIACYRGTRHVLYGKIRWRLAEGQHSSLQQDCNKSSKLGQSKEGLVLVHL